MSLDQSISFGFCHCGCGIKTKIARQTRSICGHIKGQPVRFMVGHATVRRDFSVSVEPFMWKGESCRYIALTRGQLAIVEESLFEWLNQWKWHALWSETAHSFYAARAVTAVDGNVHMEMMHRQILGLSHDDSRLGDHKDAGQTLDNRRSNLRIADSTENCRNSRRYKNSTSGFKGVSWHKGHAKWKASIRINKVLTHLGYFVTPEAAYQAYKEASIKHFGEFARY